MVLILLAKAGKAKQRSLKLWSNAVHERLQFIVSKPDGPAASSVCKAEDLMSSSVMLSNKIGWKSLIAEWLIIGCTQDLLDCPPGGRGWVFRHDMIKTEESTLFSLGEIMKSSPDPSLHHQLAWTWLP